jgi:hypothetical protein
MTQCGEIPHASHAASLAMGTEDGRKHNRSEAILPCTKSATVRMAVSYFSRKRTSVSGQRAMHNDRRTERLV